MTHINVMRYKKDWAINFFSYPMLSHHKTFIVSINLFFLLQNENSPIVSLPNRHFDGILQV